MGCRGSGDSGVQGFRGSGVQGFRGSGFRGFREVKLIREAVRDSGLGFRV